MSPGGRHGHKIREYQRRIDAVLERERERRRPPPPPISAEHAALRQGIIEALKAIEWDFDDLDWRGLPSITLETIDHSLDALVLMREEEELLAKHGVDYRPYKTYQLE
jgi:hypothetical protein